MQRGSCRPQETEVGGADEYNRSDARQFLVPHDVACQLVQKPLYKDGSSHFKARRGPNHISAGCPGETGKRFVTMQPPQSAFSKQIWGPLFTMAYAHVDAYLFPHVSANIWVAFY